MAILIGLVPALLWGITPLWTHFLGGNTMQQLLGTTYGAMIVGLIIIWVKHPALDMMTFFWCFISGITWTIGQYNLYQGFKYLGVATTMPIITGIQLVGVNIIGVVFFGSWSGMNARVIGFTAVALVAIGVYLSTRSDQTTTTTVDKANWGKHLFNLIVIGGTGYTASSTLPKLTNADGWTTFPMQAIGMLVGALLIASFAREYRGQHYPLQKNTWKNVFTGINSGVGTAGYLISITINGVSTGFTLSQMCVVVSTFGGLVILREQKTHRELWFTVIGVALVLVGGIMTSFIR